MISPIPNSGQNDLGGVSVAKYINTTQHDVSHDGAQQHPNQSTYKSPARLRTSQKAELVGQTNEHELDRSFSPSRDMARSIIHKEQKTFKSK